jgi:tripartite-type tricarboxylate transporter receptor subunit TctC
VRIVVGYGAGGVSDLIAPDRAKRLGQPFIVENPSGGGTNIATEAIVRAPADGYSLLLVAPPSAINATLYEKLNFTFIRDIAPVASINRTPGRDGSQSTVSGEDRC